MGRVLEFGSMFILGILLILAMTHFLNGTLISWVQSKYGTQPLPTGEKMMPGQKPSSNPPAVQGNPLPVA